MRIREKSEAIDKAIATMRERAINSSYGCAYYPWVRLKDTANGNGDVLMCPPSVAALKTPFTYILVLIPS